MGTGHGNLDVSQLEGVLAERIPEFWPLVLDRITQACASVDGENTPEDYRQACASGRMQLWLHPIDGELAGFVITSIKIGFRCHIELLHSDDFDQIFSEIGTIEAWAKEQGCEGMSLDGRYGWARRLRSHGWTPRTVYMDRAL